MTDDFVFVISPYVTGAAVVPACIVRYLLSWRRASSTVARAASEAHAAVRAAWRLAIGVVAIGHLVGLAFPESVLWWNHQPARLLLLESTGLTAGVLSLAALGALSVQRLRSSAAIGSPWDVVAWTLMVIGLASGAALAISFRWASSWSAVTVAPYLHSLLRLEPATTLVRRLPLLARVHIFCGFAAAAVAPLTTSARLIFRGLDLAIRWTGSRTARVTAMSQLAADVASVRLRPLSARMMRSDGEEN
jgi:nitrate reductase gamma subunit